jgi:hypothetical protein
MMDPTGLIELIFVNQSRNLQWTSDKVEFA